MSANKTKQSNKKLRDELVTLKLDNLFLTTRLANLNRKLARYREEITTLKANNVYLGDRAQYLSSQVNKHIFFPEITEEQVQTLLFQTLNAHGFNLFSFKKEYYPYAKVQGVKYIRDFLNPYLGRVQLKLIVDLVNKWFAEWDTINDNPPF